jgi:heme-degrading monooxygenase HmoA
MPSTETGLGLLTFVNVFTVQPEKRQEVVSLLRTAARKTMCHLSGFVSANVYRSLDGKRGVNYVQWKSMADFQAMRKNPEALLHIHAVAALAQFDAVVCEVGATIEAAPGPLD